MEIETLTYQVALAKISGLASQLGTEQIHTNNCLLRTLAEDLIADTNSPPFHKSSMDGYACRRIDLSQTLKVIATIYAGTVPQQPLQPNTCMRIMTGGMVPNGADCVVMQEEIEVYENNTIRCLNPNTKNNICHIGEDYKIGTVLLNAGTVLKAQHMPIIAAAGKEIISVYKKPAIGLITTGTEVVEPWCIPGKGKIRNTNALQLTGQLEELYFKPTYYGIISDSTEALFPAIEKSVLENDITILTGGVSVGELDLVNNTILQLGLEIHVQKTAIQPGRPMIFATKGNKYVFGLSGNPVSSFLQFHYYVRPFLNTITGSDNKPSYFSLKLTEDYKRKKSETMFLHPSYASSGFVTPLPFNGSAHIFAFSKANAIMEVPVGTFQLNKGDIVNVRLI